MGEQQEKRIITAASVQMAPKMGDFATNLKRMSELIHEVMKHKPETRLIVFPELITSGYESGRRLNELAERVEDSESIRTMGALAKQYGTNILYGFPERSTEDGEMYNSTALLNEEGRVLQIYRKIHLFNMEKKYFRPGNRIEAVDTSFGRLGVMVCWDSAFPEMARTLAMQGAELLAVCTNWEYPYQEDWDLVTKARAFDNCMPLVSSNRVGADKYLRFFGHSNIIGPTGQVIAALNEEREGFITAELDLNENRELREKYYNFLGERRPELYFHV